MNAKIRSTVHVWTNALGSIYEATDMPEVTRVYIRQHEVWFQGGKLMESERIVAMDDECRLYKKMMTLPGNIVKGYTTQELDAGDVELVVDSNGEPVLTNEGNQIWQFWYYSPGTKYQSGGELILDDKLDEIINAITK